MAHHQPNLWETYLLVSQMVVFQTLVILKTALLLDHLSFICLILRRDFQLSHHAFNVHFVVQSNHVRSTFAYPYNVSTFQRLGKKAEGKTGFMFDDGKASVRPRGD